MPIYEYICLDCKNRFDAIRSMKDADSPIRCDQCESDHTSRMISVFYAQSAGKVVAGGNAGGCAGCSGGTCSTCGH
jgi:putative FmdB family regulatory protein